MRKIIGFVILAITGTVVDIVAVKCNRKHYAHFDLSCVQDMFR